MANYYKRKNGTYCVRVSNGMKNGKQELVSATYKPPVGATPLAAEKGAKEFADLFEAAVHNGLYIPGMRIPKDTVNPSGMTVDCFIKKYYYGRIEAKLSPNTVRFYKSICEQFIIPSYGTIRLTDITAKHLQAFIDYLAATGSRADEKNKAPLSASTIRRYATVFSSVMTEACRMGYVENNKLQGCSVQYPKIIRKPIRVYDDNESELFYQALRNEPLQTQGLLLSALLLGLRRGEIVALRWSDIDFQKCCLHIEHSAYKSKGEKQALKAPKSMNSFRTVFFPKVYADTLMNLKTEQDEQRKCAGDKWQEQDFVFTTATGDMISLYAPTDICSRFEEKNGLHHLKLHGLRHTCVSLLVEHGVDPETVKSMLGHESLKTTALYLHPYDSNMKGAADILEKVVAKNCEVRA